MPELPEVETTRRGIEPHISGKKVKQLIVRNPNLRWPVPDGLEELLAGKKLLSVGRRGKYLLLDFGVGTVLWHLGMSGALRVLLGKNTVEPARVHDHIDLVFQGQVAVRFTDPRRFGAFLWTDQPVVEHELIAHLGPEPLTDAFTGEYLYRQSRKRQVALKTFIMDSKVVVGVGNIYANEALFAAGLRPEKSAGQLTKPKAALLVQEIRRILADAIERGGTTLRDFTNSEGKPGYFAQQLSVYGRADQPCRRCAKPLTEIRMANRSTVFCRRCQK